MKSLIIPQGCYYYHYHYYYYYYPYYNSRNKNQVQITKQFLKIIFFSRHWGKTQDFKAILSFCREEKTPPNVTSRHAPLLFTSGAALFSERLTLQKALLEHSQRELEITLGQLKCPAAKTSN